MTAAAPASHTLEFALTAMRGTLLQLGRAPGSDHFAGGAYDSREVARGQIFFALPGAQVDGFSFCAGAAAAGASVIVVAADRGLPRRRCPVDRRQGARGLPDPGHHQGALR